MKSSGSGRIPCLAIMFSIILLTGCRSYTDSRDGGQAIPSADTLAAVGDKPWLLQVNLEQGEGVIELPGTTEPPLVYFLLFGNHSFEPGSLIVEKKVKDTWENCGDRTTVHIGDTVVLGLFQELRAVPWSVPAGVYEPGASYRFRVSRTGGVNSQPDRDEHWDQVIMVPEAATGTRNMAELGTWRLIESGEFGQALPPHIRNISFTPQEIDRQQNALTDPLMDLLKGSPGEELGWQDLESMALPLDYQKILLAGLNDADPGYAYQNGQWFVVWPGRDGTKVSDDVQMRKDVWFAPAIRIGNEIIRPAPLSAETGFLKNKHGRYLPMLQIKWEYRSPDSEEIKVYQSLFSGEMDGVPQLFVHLQLEDPQRQAHLLIAHGKRANAFYWGDRSQARTFIPYFTTRPQLAKKNDYVLVDELSSVVLRSSRPVRILHSGISEVLIEIDGGHSGVYIATPQVRTAELPEPLTGNYFRKARKKFEKTWKTTLSSGARADLPSYEWNRRVDSWLSQISSITRIQLDGRDRLCYGSYIYSRYYFGIEEGWSTVAHALWGNGEEAKRQAEIILSEENLDKTDYHHQYRNGLSSWYAAKVMRLTGDRDWLEKISPALVTNGYWTIEARKQNEGERTPTGKGLLPSHVYGGDISTPAYSLYSSGTCLKGLWETSDVFRRSGLEELQDAVGDFQEEAGDFRRRLVEVMNGVLDRESEPPFLPFALEVENKPGNHEGPFERITDTQLGNYYNLFAPLFLHLGVFRYRDRELPSEWITDYVESHEGLFAGLPRFYSGLDAVYSIGNVHEYLERSKADITLRARALAGLESYMALASSRNGYTVQEVSGFYPERLDWKEYERVVREALWNFGMYSVESYLRGHSSFTEPLGAGAGEGLWLIRESLIDEGRDGRGLPDGDLFLLPTVPGDWLREGEEIRLEGFPTAYGTFDLQVNSYISSKREVHVSYRFSSILGKDPATGSVHRAWYELDKLLIRLVPAREDRLNGRKPKIEPPLLQYDEWTIELPVQEKGEFIIRF